MHLFTQSTKWLDDPDESVLFSRSGNGSWSSRASFPFGFRHSRLVYFMGLLRGHVLPQVSLELAHYQMGHIFSVPRPCCECFILPDLYYIAHSTVSYVIGAHI